MDNSGKYELWNSLSPDKRTVLFQLERLRRNYDTCIQTYDQIALYELSHSLRIWTDLTTNLPTIAPAFGTTLAFRSVTPPKKLMRALKGRAFVLAYMPGGVTTYAHEGNLVSSPKVEPSVDFSLGAICQVNVDGSAKLSSYHYAETVLDDAHFELLKRQDVSKFNYVQWMKAEAVRLWFPDQLGEMKTLMISREMIISRVANTLDGSHPSAALSYGNVANRFDAPVHHLLQYKLGGLPLPYFILLKIAQDILENAGKLLGIPKPDLPASTPC